MSSSTKFEGNHPKPSEELFQTLALLIQQVKRDTGPTDRDRY